MNIITGICAVIGIVFIAMVRHTVDGQLSRILSILRDPAAIKEYAYFQYYEKKRRCFLARDGFLLLAIAALIISGICGITGATSMGTIALYVCIILAIMGVRMHVIGRRLETASVPVLLATFKSQKKRRWIVNAIILIAIIVSLPSTDSSIFILCIVTIALVLLYEAVHLQLAKIHKAI